MKDIMSLYLKSFLFYYRLSLIPGSSTGTQNGRCVRGHSVRDRRVRDRHVRDRVVRGHPKRDFPNGGRNGYQSIASLV